MNLLADTASFPFLLLEVFLGFAVFWVIRVATRGKLGLGDAKYSAFIAVSLGLHGWLAALMVASVTGLCTGLILVGFHRIPRTARIPFAPFLTFGSVVSVAMQCLFPGAMVV